MPPYENEVTSLILLRALLNFIQASVSRLETNVAEMLVRKGEGERLAGSEIAYRTEGLMVRRACPSAALIDDLTVPQQDIGIAQQELERRDRTRYLSDALLKDLHSLTEQIMDEVTPTSDGPLTTLVQSFQMKVDGLRVRSENPASRKRSRNASAQAGEGSSSGRGGGAVGRGRGGRSGGGTGGQKAASVWQAASGDSGAALGQLAEALGRGGRVIVSHGQGGEQTQMVIDSEEEEGNGEEKGEEKNSAGYIGSRDLEA